MELGGPEKRLVLAKLGREGEGGIIGFWIASLLIDFCKKDISTKL